MTAAPLLCALLVASHAPAGGVTGSYARTCIRGHEQVAEAASRPAGASSPRTRWASPCTYGETASDRTKQYNGRVYDPGTGFHDYGARLYWPEIGRFISADSYLGDPATPASLNRYSYVHNNPYKYTDATGHCPSCVLAGVGFVIGGAWAGIAAYRNGGSAGDIALAVAQGGSAGAIIGATLGMATEAVVGGAALWQANRAANSLRNVTDAEIEAAVNAEATSGPLIQAPAPTGARFNVSGGMMVNEHTVQSTSSAAGATGDVATKIRVHTTDPTAPAGSNSATGNTVSITQGGGTRRVVPGDGWIQTSTATDKQMDSSHIPIHR